MKKFNWNEVKEAGTFLPAGGYVCGITSVEDVPDKEYLMFKFDIAEGEYSNYYRSLNESKGFWGGSFVKSYKEKALSFFKSMIICFEKSNEGFKFVDDEKTFKRKRIGLVLSEEEYEKKDGSIGTRLYVSDFKTVDEIRNGEYKVAELKKLAGSSTSAYRDLPMIEDDDDDLPFN